MFVLKRLSMWTEQIESRPIGRLKMGIQGKLHFSVPTHDGQVNLHEYTCLSGVANARTCRVPGAGRPAARPQRLRGDGAIPR
jgi:hypothetical protein